MNPIDDLAPIAIQLLMVLGLFMLGLELLASWRYKRRDRLEYLDTLREIYRDRH